MTPAPINLRVFRDPNAQDLPLPHYTTNGAAAMDLYANIHEDILLLQGERALIPTGLHVEVPPGHFLDVRPRSGLALKNGISIVNTPGTVDCDYRGDVGVILINTSNEPFVVSRGQRIAQMLILPFPSINIIPVDSLEELSTTQRGTEGFGSTGK